MRILVTGASGFVGSAVVRELLSFGHTVLGLARSDEAAQKVIQLGASPVHGTLDDARSLSGAASDCDGVVHTAFIHDFSRYQQSAAIDYNAIQALASSGRPLVITSTLGLSKSRRLGLESDSIDASFGRKSEAGADQAISEGADVRVVRLPPSVHGEGDHAFAPFLIDLARQKGFSAYVGDGANLWSAVHRLDAARLFRLALEKGEAGARYHAAADEGIPFRELAFTIGQNVGANLASLAESDADKHFTWITPFVRADFGASSQLTREALGWKPKQPGLIEDLKQGAY